MMLLTATCPIGFNLEKRGSDTPRNVVSNSFRTRQSNSRSHAASLNGSPSTPSDNFGTLKQASELMVRLLAPAPPPSAKAGLDIRSPARAQGRASFQPGVQTMDNAEHAVSQRAAAGAGLMVFFFGLGLTAALVFLIAVWMPA